MSLSMRQEMAIWETGRCRCPHCGKFRKPADFPDQPARHNFDGPGFVGSMSVPPQCCTCLAKNKDTDDE
jgi:hypothetical protein